MVAIIVILSVVVPMLEVLIFAAIHEHAGIWPIVAPCVVSGVVGIVILARAIPRFMDDSMNRDKVATFPTMQSYFDATRVISGILLLLPGFITDVMGLILLLPTFRGLSFVLLARLTSTRRERIVMVEQGNGDKEPD